mgnify:CR=1 FL=1
MIKISGLCKSFGKHEVLKNLNLTLEDNGVYCLMGPSGMGKTTLLRIIMQLEKSDAGSIEGADLKDISVMFQEDRLCDVLTPVENVVLVCEKNVSRKKIYDNLCKILPKECLIQPVSELSGGMKRRVCLVRAMMKKSDTVILDEPFSALDGYLKDVLQREMQDFLQDYPGDMILVTHSRDEAYKFCKELSVVDGGRILVTDETKRLFENPRMLEAAKLTGCKNFSAVQRLGEHEIYATDWKIKLHTAEKVAEDITHVGIRGHWIRPEDKPGENCLEVQVDEYIETTFEHQYMIRRKGEEAAAGLWWMRPKNSFREDPDRGLPKYLYLPPEHLMLLK